jgi:hypothetical protein
MTTVRGFQRAGAVGKLGVDVITGGSATTGNGITGVIAFARGRFSSNAAVIHSMTARLSAGSTRVETCDWICPEYERE